MNHVRHISIFSIPSSFVVTIVGVGGIGAAAALCLAKMGVKNMVIFDHDTIDDENMPTQLHLISCAGKSKVEGVAEMLAMFSDELAVFPIDQWVDRDTDLEGDLIIAAADGIAARKEIWAAAQGGSWFLDTRMAAEEYQHFLVDMENPGAVKEYHAMLDALSDESVPDLPCTAKATMYCAFTAAAHVGSVVKEIVSQTAVSHRLVHHIPSNTLATFNI